jgi:hypothetical protein
MGPLAPGSLHHAISTPPVEAQIGGPKTGTQLVSRKTTLSLIPNQTSRFVTGPMLEDQGLDCGLFCDDRAEAAKAW